MLKLRYPQKELVVMLSDIKVRSARPKEKPYKLSDEKGLFLYVTPVGGKLWRFK